MFGYARDAEALPRVAPRGTLRAHYTAALHRCRGLLAAGRADALFRPDAGEAAKKNSTSTKNLTPTTSPIEEC